jgi:RNA polymerase sigma factor (sigma-70 family)
MDKSLYLQELSDPENQDFLYKYVGSMIYGHSNIEDLVQDINLKVIEKYPNYSDEGKFKGWLSSIAFWSVKAYKKKMFLSKVSYCGGFSEGENFDIFNSYFENPEIFSSKKEVEVMMEEVGEVLRFLPQQSRDIMKLYFQGFKPRYIAEEVRRKISVVYKTRTRVLSEVKKRVEDRRKLKKVLTSKRR